MNNNTNKTMQTLVMMLMMVLAAIAGPIAITPASNAEDQTAFPTEVREVPQLNTLTRARKGSKKGARPQNGGNKGNKRKSGNGPAKGKTSLKERFNARFKSQRRLGELDMYCQKKQLQNPDMMAREMAHIVHAEGGNPNRVAAERPSRPMTSPLGATVTSSARAASWCALAIACRRVCLIRS